MKALLITVNITINIRVAKRYTCSRSFIFSSMRIFSCIMHDKAQNNSNQQDIKDISPGMRIWGHKLKVITFSFSFSICSRKS